LSRTEPLNVALPTISLKLPPRAARRFAGWHGRVAARQPGAGQLRAVPGGPWRPADPLAVQLDPARLILRGACRKATGKNGLFRRARPLNAGPVTADLASSSGPGTGPERRARQPQCSDARAAGAACACGRCARFVQLNVARHYCAVPPGLEEENGMERAPRTTPLC
jgi:hypothetical protein